MSLPGYHFIREVEKFRMVNYDAHLGWLNSEPNDLKIYTLPGSPHFYLHHQSQDRLFEVEAEVPKKLSSKEEYMRVFAGVQDIYNRELALTRKVKNCNLTT